MRDYTAKSPKKVIRINHEELRDHLSSIVTDTVEEVLNKVLDSEADEMVGAARYERSSDRQDYRSGSYTRKLQTKAGEVTLKVPKLREQRFQTAVIERYRRRESSVEEALVEMYLAGVSTRRVADITEALWDTRVSSATVSKLNCSVYEHIEKWRNRPIEGEFPYVYLDGVSLKRSWGGEVGNVSVLIAIGVGTDGYRRVLGVVEGAKEDKAGWSGFLRHLKQRGLCGVRMFISDACLGLVESIGDFYPEALWQRCVVHFYRNVFSYVPRGRVGEVSLMLKAIHASENEEAARGKAKEVVNRLKGMRLGSAAKWVEENIEETLCYYGFPSSHWRRTRTNNPMERIIKEIRRRSRVVGAFPDGQSALMLCAARLRHISGTKWGSRRYLDMDLLREMDRKEEVEVG